MAHACRYQVNSESVTVDQLKRWTRTCKHFFM